MAEKKDYGGVRSPLPESRKKRVYQPYYDAAVADMLEVLVEKLQLALRKIVRPLPHAEP
ncbi:MAG: hypothetical protein LBD93_02825 [Treponema sp.]|nr:hypothetical protein [Treponema sp.]